MEIIIVYGVLAAVFFASSFVMKRRFGLLGLALAAGSLLSGMWGYDVGLIAGIFGLPGGPLTSAVATSVMVLLPAGLLLFHGYTYKTMLGRVIGASMFTILALAFLVEPLSNVLIAQGPAVGLYNWLVANKTSVIGVGLVAAVIDLFLTKPARHDKYRK